MNGTAKGLPLNDGKCFANLRENPSTDLPDWNHRMALKYPLMRGNFSREDLDLVIEHLKQDDPFLTNGRHCREFEAQWSEWLGVKHSVFVNSGTSANILSIDVLKLRYREGGEVIVPPITWVSDISAVLRAGFTPVFADIDPRTLSMSTECILEKLTEKTRAVFMTHAQGFHGLTDELLAELDARDIWLIEDVCESHGCEFRGKKGGSFGIMSNFSFYYAHHMSTIEGGMVCTNDDRLYQDLRMLRAHGMVRESNDQALKDGFIADNPELNSDFIFSVPGYNFRNNEIGGILGKSQLRKLDKNNARRTENLELFLSLIDDRHYRTDFEVEGSSNYAFNLVLRNKDHELMARLCNALRANGIEFRRGSAGGGNQLRQPYLKDIVGETEYLEYPEAEHIHFFGMYIGNFPDLNADEIREVVAVINRAAEG